jgi:hypothetical protein
MIRFIHKTANMAYSVKRGSADYRTLSNDPNWIEETTNEPKIEKQVKEVEVKGTNPKTNEEVKIEELGYNELKELAKEKGIKGYSRMKKELLIQALSTEETKKEEIEEDELLEEEEDK